MAYTGRKAKNMKHVGFRMPLDLYDDYVAVAQSRGVDLSSVFNWTLNEFRPALLLNLAKHRAGMLRAAIADQQDDDRDERAIMLAALTEMLAKMDGFASIVQKRSDISVAREAA
jgi:hypothetical protein